METANKKTVSFNTINGIGHQNNYSVFFSNSFADDIYSLCSTPQTLEIYTQCEWVYK